MAKVYKFKCKNCNHEYLANDQHIADCTECGIENKNIGII